MEGCSTKLPSSEIEITQTSKWNPVIGKLLIFFSSIIFIVILHSTTESRYRNLERIRQMHIAIELDKEVNIDPSVELWDVNIPSYWIEREIRTRQLFLWNLFVSIINFSQCVLIGILLLFKKKPWEWRYYSNLQLLIAIPSIVFPSFVLVTLFEVSFNWLAILLAYALIGVTLIADFTITSRFSSDDNKIPISCPICLIFIAPAIVLLALNTM